MQSTHGFNGKAVLALSLELSAGSWKTAATDSQRDKPSVYTHRAAGAGERLGELLDCIEQLKKRWQLPTDCAVWVLYEAGQDGFWIARALRERGVGVLVVDAASVPVARQARRAKTDRLPTKVDETGVTRIFDPKTGAFAAYNRDGTTKTFFKPGSPGYFDRQPGRLIAP